MTNEAKLQAAIDRIRSRLAGEWYDPTGELESDIAKVLRELDGTAEPDDEGEPEDSDDNPFDPESPEGRAFEEGRMTGDGQMKPATALEDSRPRYSLNRMRHEVTRAREAGMESAAELIVKNVIMDTSFGKVLAPRRDGNRDGLLYAEAIRAAYLKARNA